MTTSNYELVPRNESIHIDPHIEKKKKEKTNWSSSLDFPLMTAVKMVNVYVTYPLK